jgi:peptidase S41-like protein
MMRKYEVLSRSLLFLSLIGLLGQTICWAQSDQKETDMQIDSRMRSEVIDSLVRGLDSLYIYPEIADKLGRMFRERQSRGEYNHVTSAIAFSEILTEQMVETAHDKHLEVWFRSKPFGVMPASPNAKAPGEPFVGAPLPTSAMQKRNFEFLELKWLEGNIGYLRVDGMSNPFLGGDTAAAAMNFLANTDALIIDLRWNGGGGDMGAVLASYLFNAYSPIHLNDLILRDADSTGERVEQSWTIRYLPGKRYVNKDVYILTSKDTLSAAEGFAYELQALKRAVVVGETTGGAGNFATSYRLSDHFMATISNGKTVNPFTGSGWEGTGVTPNMIVPIQKALEAAHVAALQGLIEKTKDAGESAELTALLERVKKEYSTRKQD